MRRQRWTSHRATSPLQPGRSESLRGRVTYKGADEESLVAIYERDESADLGVVRLAPEGSSSLKYRLVHNPRGRFWGSVRYESFGVGVCTELPSKSNEETRIARAHKLLGELTASTSLDLINGTVGRRWYMERTVQELVPASDCITEFRTAPAKRVEGTDAARTLRIDWSEVSDVDKAGEVILYRAAWMSADEFGGLKAKNDRERDRLIEAVDHLSSICWSRVAKPDAPGRQDPPVPKREVARALCNLPTKVPASTTAIEVNLEQFGCLFKAYGYARGIHLLAAIKGEGLIPGSYRFHEEASAAKSDAAQELLTRRVDGLVSGRRDRPLFVYCEDSRCTTAPELAQRLNSAGYTDVYLLSGGASAWKASGNRLVAYDVDEMQDQPEEERLPPRFGPGTKSGKYVCSVGGDVVRVTFGATSMASADRGGVEIIEFGASQNFLSPATTNGDGATFVQTGRGTYLFYNEGASLKLRRDLLTPRSYATGDCKKID